MTSQQSFYSGGGGGEGAVAAADGAPGIVGIVKKEEPSDCSDVTPLLVREASILAEGGGVRSPVGGEGGLEGVSDREGGGGGEDDGTSVLISALADARELCYETSC